MAAETIVIDISTRYTDYTNEGFTSQKRSLDSLYRSVSRTQAQFDRLLKTKAQISLEAKDNATRIIQTAYYNLLRYRSLGGLSKTLTVLDNATAATAGIYNGLKRIVASPLTLSISLLDNVTAPARNLISSLSNVETYIKYKIYGTIAKFTASPVQQASTQEQVKLQLGNLLYNTGGYGLEGEEKIAKQMELGQERLNELVQLAGESPYMRDEIYQAAKILQTFGGDTMGSYNTAVANASQYGLTSSGIRLVGDLASAANADLSTVAMWMGRLYTSASQGRASGESLAALQEMALISGEEREKIEDIVDQIGKGQLDGATGWFEIEKQLQRNAGSMELMQYTFKNAMNSVKATIKNYITLPWGTAIMNGLEEGLMYFRKAKKEWGDGLNAMKTSLENVGSKIGGIAKTAMEKVTDILGNVFISDVFAEGSTAAFSDKFKVIFNGLIVDPIKDGIKGLKTWWNGGGKTEVKNFIGTVAEGITDIAKEVFSALYSNGITGTLTTLFLGKKALGGITGGITGVSAIAQSIGSNYQTVKNIVDVLKSVKSSDGIVDVAKTLMNLGQSSGDIEKMSEALGQALEKMWGNSATVAMGDASTGAGDIISNAFNNTSSAAGNATYITGAAREAKDAAEKIKDAFGNNYDIHGLSKMGDALDDTAKSAVKTADALEDAVDIADDVPTAASGVGLLGKAIGLLSNPITLVIGGLLAIAAVDYALHKNAVKKVREEYKLLFTTVDEVKESVGKFDESVSDMTEATINSYLSMQTQTYQAKAYQSQLDSLMQTESKSQAVKDQIAKTVDKLNTILPSIGLSYDAENDLLLSNNDLVSNRNQLIDDGISKMEAEAKAVMYAKLQEAAAELQAMAIVDQAKAEYAKKELERELSARKAAYSNTDWVRWDSNTMTLTVDYAGQSKARREIEAMEAEYKTLCGTVDDTNENLIVANDLYSMMSGEMATNTEMQNKFVDALAQGKTMTEAFEIATGNAAASVEELTDRINDFAQIRQNYIEQFNSTGDDNFLQLYTDASALQVAAMLTKSGKGLTALDEYNRQWQEKTKEIAASAKSSYEQIGSDAMEGFANGLQINDKAQTVTEEQMNNVIEISQNVLDTHSPSKVFYQIGLDTMKGFELGITEYDSSAIIQGLSTIFLGSINIAATAMSSLLLALGPVFVQNLTSGILEEESVLTGATMQISSDVTSLMIGTLVIPMRGIGRSAMEELYYGMMEQVSLIASGAMALVNTLVGAFRTGLGISSPSKVMKELGGFTMEGFILGLGAEDLKKFADNTVTELQDAFDSKNLNINQLVQTMGDAVPLLADVLTKRAMEKGGEQAVYPLGGGTYAITDYFGLREAPTEGASIYHQGIDIGAPYGTPVLAIGSGTIIGAGDYGGYGNMVKIAHANGTESWYAHMSSVAVGTGQIVSAGDLIGYVGSTGTSTGNHLHFSVLENGQFVDPYQYLEGATIGGSSLSSQLLSAYNGNYGAYADGGIIDKPTFALMGEGGRKELILPLSKRNRTKELMEKSGLWEENTSESTAKTFSIQFGDIVLNLNIEGLNEENPAKIAEKIKAAMPELANELCETIARKLSLTFQGMPLSA